jgi:NAD(P)-dependent dehydrogenase (short-subunit alcohol dehydrogenase family)
MTFETAQFDFTGKRALVAGGSRGIGKGLVAAFLNAGADVVYAARNPMEGEGEGNTGAHFVETDLHDEGAILALFEKIDGLGDLDFAINMAAINHCKTIENIDADEWDDVLSVNLRAAFLVCREAAKRMKQKERGSIINVSSIAGRHRSPVSGVHYVSSKAGIIGLTKQLAFETWPPGINVNVVCPSQTMTDMLIQSMTDDQRKALADSIPLRRLASVEEQVGPILFLCSDAAAYITGAVIDVNGGQV